jgi:hypothetical protein
MVDWPELDALTRSLERRRRRDMLSHTISFLRDYLFTMPVLAKFAVGMMMLVIIPRLPRACSCTCRSAA